MKKYLYLLLLPVIAFAAASCDDDDDKKPAISLGYLAGNWEVVNSDNTEYTTIYNIAAESSSLPSAGYVGYNGTLTTSYLTADNLQLHDKEYSWKIVAIEDSFYPLIELDWQADLDKIDGDQPADRFYYRIEKLTATTMRWHINSVTGEETINFIRRTDSDSQ